MKCLSYSEFLLSIKTAAYNFSDCPTYSEWIVIVTVQRKCNGESKE